MQKILIVLIIICSACTTKTKQTALELYADVEPLGTTKEISIEALHMDTLKANNPFSLSGDCFWKIEDDTLYHFDRILAVVDVYDKEGNFHRRSLGVGRGPGEVMEEIGTVCEYRGGWLLTEVYNIYHFNPVFNDKQMKFLFHFGNDIEQRKQDLYKNPDPTKDVELYVPDYTTPQMMVDSDQDVVMKISCEYPDFMEQHHYQSSALVGHYDFERGCLTQMMGRYPPCYQSEEGAPAFSNHYFSPYKDGRYLVSFGLDPQIYICDDQFRPKKSFGLAGCILNADYKMVKLDSGERLPYDYFEEELKRKGYYTSVYYCPDQDITFRIYKTGLKPETYTNGEVTNPSRMQIFKGTDLVGDVSVPDKFEIIDYQAPYFFADGYYEIGEETDQIGVYKFKL